MSKHPPDANYVPPPQFVPALGFRALTPLYDAVVRATTRERRFKRTLIRQLELREGHSVLDLATGTGTLAIWMKQAEPQATVTAVDIDPDILAGAQRKASLAGTDIRFDRAVCQALPYPDASFDRVEEAGFSDVRETRTFSTLLGTIALYRAVKPDGADLAASAGDTPPESRIATVAAP
jgi:ubiquinone/menaquinone biosynthesis C-methylase UbiE